MTKKIDLVGIDSEYGCDVGGLFKKHTQELSDDFLTGLKEQRNASSGPGRRVHACRLDPDHRRREVDA